MPKPTFASVTEEPCKCDYLQRSADEPDNPITFNVPTGEFQFAYGDSILVIYHCPFCGGAAPASKRELLFEVIPRDERERLTDLLDGIRTIDDAVRELGPPDWESHATSNCPEQDGNPPRVESERVIHYNHLSKVADVWIFERWDGIVYWNLQGKEKV